MWNTTASVPIGLYALSRPYPIARGDLVAIAPEPVLARRLAAQGLLPPGVPLLKPVAAVTGQTVCRRGTRVTVEGQVVAQARRRDGTGRALPSWSGCQRLAAGEVFVLSAAPGSFDGRYFGVTPRAAIIAEAQAVWIPRPGEPRR